MKLFSTAFYAVIFGSILLLCKPIDSKSLLGSTECTWGPSYWCSNITNAKNCHAVRHCIQTVWEKQTVPEDNDSICQICLDMVKQARDQLESNETQEDIKAVFEGSCKLIPLKPIKKECIKLADDFVPELVEALASQMNPQVVCSVAGLCNNAKIDKMLEEMTLTTTTASSVEDHKSLTCSECNNVASLISNKFHSKNPDDILENLLHFCGKLSSFSDACSNVILTYFNDIYNELKLSMNADAICHISGVCASNYHQHPELVEIRPMSNVGVVQVKDDVPCELCEQLVRHLRDLLVANTTETEFKEVLEGLCKQTKGFKDECLSIVDQYYDVIYNTLVHNLDENNVCFMIGICPKGNGINIENDERPIAPLLPAIEPQKIEVTIKEKPKEIKKKLLGENEPKYTKEEIQSMQLPIDRLLGPQHPETLVEGGELCTICEYFLHFVQEALSSPANEDKIKEVVSNTCKKLPDSIRGKCDDFVDMYGDAIIALLIQEIDPRQVCPMLKLCPSGIEDMEVFAPQPINVKINAKSSTTDKPTCPLCLFAVQQVQEMIKSDKSKENIKHALDNLCVHLPKKLQAECVDFVDTYSSELVEMLITDFTPQQICVYLKLCPDNKPDLSTLNIKIDNDDDNDEILTNEIPDDTINGRPITTADKEVVSTPECLLCQKIIKEAEKRILNPKSKEQVKNALEHACDKLHNHELIKKCHDYIEKHGDMIVALLMKELTPKMICREIGYCIRHQEFDDLDIDEAIKIDVVAIPSKHIINIPFEKMTGLDDIITRPIINKDSTPCVICEFIMAKLEHELQNKTTKDEIKNAIKNICKKMPKTIEQNCNKFMTDYADLILNLLDSIPPKEICQRLDLCQPSKIANIPIPPSSSESESMEAIVSVEFSKINDEVIECGVCHGATIGLVSLIKEKNDDKNLEINNMIEVACDEVAAKYYTKCSQLLQLYGESIINLIRSGVDESQICSRIGKCFEEEKSNWAYMMLGGNNDSLNRKRRSTELLGSNKCTWGPSYWCANKSNAEECKSTEFCVQKVWGQEVKQN